MGRLVSLLSVCLLVACGATEQPPIETPEEVALSVELRANRIVFNHRIVFRHDSAEILPESFEVLDRVGVLLSEHPDIIRVQVQGHSSTDGDQRHNRQLSAERATAVADYLRTAGVEQEVTSQGYGETYPLCQDDTAECHERNRRVEFFVDER